MLIKYKVAAYFSGHDHDMQHLNDSGVQYFLSGAGHLVESSQKHKVLLRTDICVQRFTIWKLWALDFLYLLKQTLCKSVYNTHIADTHIHTKKNEKFLHFHLQQLT